MLLQIMGIVDVLAAILLTLNYLGFGFSLLFYLSIFIVIKSLLFFDGIVGVIDLIGGLLILWVTLFSIQLYPLSGLKFRAATKVKLQRKLQNRQKATPLSGAALLVLGAS